MKVKDIPADHVEVGLRVKSLISDKWGTVVEVDPNHDYSAWILWDGESEVYSAFYGTDCRCECDYKE